MSKRISNAGLLALFLGCISSVSRKIKTGVRGVFGLFHNNCLSRGGRRAVLPRSSFMAFVISLKGWVFIAAFFTLISPQISHSAITDIYWRVLDADSLGLEGAKFATAEAACLAGIAAKERRNSNQEDMEWRQNPDFDFYWGGSYTWGNLGKKPSDPGFDNSSRQVECNHEYKQPGKTWLTFWPYSGATVTLVGSSCPSGTAWNSNDFGCLPVTEGFCKNYSSNGSNPIDGATGNKYEAVVDYQSPKGKLTFQRFYNSALSVDINDAALTALGAKWKSNYHYSVTTTDIQGCNASNSCSTIGQAVSLEEVNGSSIIAAGSFPRNPGDGYYVYKPSSLENYSLIRSNTGWEYSKQDGTVLIFDDSGVLQSISNLDGYEQTLSYDANDLVQTLTDSEGRNITFDYDTQNRLKTITTPDGIITYSYDSNDNLVNVGYPDGTSVTYIYDDPRYLHALTGIVDQNGNRYATWTYDDQGRADSSEHAVVLNALNLFTTLMEQR